MTHQKVHLFVGFGGSGGKTLASFAELASQNRKWAEDAHKNCYFLICDTNTADLKHSEKRIHDAFRYVGLEPEIQVVGLADQIDDLQDSIHEVFEHASSEGLKQLKECWWYDENTNRPFVATGLGNHPSNGAGQCPAVAHYLAWRSFRRLEDSVKAIHASINRTHMHGGRFPVVDVSFVSSLAGGTGRGAWPLLGFLIRQTFKEAAGKKFAPQGYFFDKSCFPEVEAISSLQKTKITVNSLTGFSELSMWVRNDNQSLPTEPILHWVPSLESPEEKSQNIITIDPSNTSMPGKSPIKSAWVIFNESKAGGMESSDDYYEMVAGCLYSQVCTGLAATMNNEDPVIGSAASARYEVNVKGIRDYLRDQVIVGLCDDRAKSEGGGDDVDLSPDKDLIDRWNFNIDKFGQSLEDSTWTGRFAKAVSKAQKYERLFVCMEEQEVEDAEDCASQLDKPKRDLVARALLKTFPDAKQGSSSPVEELAQVISDSICQEVKECKVKHSMPLPRLQKLCKSMESSLNRQAKGLKDISSSPSTPVTDFVNKVKGRGPGPTFLKFIPAEIAKAKTQVPNLSAQAAKHVVAEILSSSCESAASILHKWAANIESAQTELHDAKTKYEDRLHKSEETLFTTKKNGKWDIFGDKDVIYSSRRIVQRTLRPALSEGLLQDIKRDLMGMDSVKKKHAELLQGLLGDDLSEEVQLVGTNQAEFRRKLDKSLEDIHAALNIDDKTMEKYFSLDNVVEDLLGAWEERVGDMPEGPERTILSKLFASEFGLELIPEEGNNVLTTPDLDEVLVAMTFDLAKSCDAFFKLERVPQDRIAQGDTVFVSLPNREEFKKLKDQFKDSGRVEKAGLNGVAFKPEFNHFTSNPYVIAAFTHEGAIQNVTGLEDVHKDAVFNNIVSLNYWQKDPGILKWLRLCESSEGDSFFRGVANTFGLGYSDPRYVNSPNYTNKRWSPWSLERPGEEQDRLDILDCVIYATLGNLPESNNLTEEQYEQCQRTLADIAKHCSDWAMPLISKDANNFLFERKPIHKDESLANPLCLRGDVCRKTKIGSVVTLMKGFAGNKGDAQANRKAILVEEKLFNSEFKGSIVGNESIKLLHQAQKIWLTNQRDTINAVAQEDEWSGIYNELIDRLKHHIDG
jgi:hypothetical protein